MQRLPEGAGVNKIKGKRRDLQRLLKKPGLSAEKKREVERALQVLAGDLEGALNRNKTKKIAQKYHMVRFFERKKALRAIKKNAGASELADFYYIMDFPKDTKYAALYAEGSPARESQLYKDLLDKAKQGQLEVPKPPKREPKVNKDANKKAAKNSKPKAEPSSDSGNESGSGSESESEAEAGQESEAHSESD